MRGSPPAAKPRRRPSSSSLSGCVLRCVSVAGSWMRSMSTVTTATAAPALAVRAWTGCATTPRWPTWTWSWWSRRAGTLLPWTRAPFGYRVDPQRPGEVAGVRVEPDEAVLVAQLFDWYLEAGVTLYRLAKRLTDLGIATPTGKPRWNVASVRGILRNPAYAGRAQTNRTRVAPARQRKSALLPVGPGQSHAPRPPEEWITVAVPQIVSEETFAQVQAKLDTNQQGAARNARHPYLLRALVSCGACRLSCTARTTQNGYNYYLCVGRTDALRRAQGQRCTARYAPAGSRWGVAAARAARPPAHHRPGHRAAGAPAAAAVGRLPGRGRRPGRVRAQARGAGAPPGHPGRPAAPAGRDRAAAAGAWRCRRRDRAFLPDRPGRAGHGHVHPAAAAGGAAHRPGGRDRRRGRDPLRAAHRTRGPAPALLPVAERPSPLRHRAPSDRPLIVVVGVVPGGRRHASQPHCAASRLPAATLRDRWVEPRGSRCRDGGCPLSGAGARETGWYPITPRRQPGQGRGRRCMVCSRVC